MVLFWICLFALLNVGALGDESCPTPQELAPCTCDGEGVNCMLAKNESDIRRAFKSNFKYGGVRSVWIQGVPLPNIAGDLFSTIRSPQFYIELANVTTIDMKAFKASERTLSTLSLFGNKIVNFPYGDLTRFDRLMTLNLGRNLINSIPQNAFVSRSLYTIILTQNKISSIGMNAFADVPNLQKLDLPLNPIHTLGPMSLASKQHSPGLLINLSANRISDVSDSAFTGTTPVGLFLSQNQLTSLKQGAFANLITRIAQQRGFIEVSNNPFSCRGCDFSWLVVNKFALMGKLVGFTCTNGIGLDQLTRQSIGC